MAFLITYLWTKLLSRFLPHWKPVKWAGAVLFFSSKIEDPAAHQYKIYGLRFLTEIMQTLPAPFISAKWNLRFLEWCTQNFVAFSLEKNWTITIHYFLTFPETGYKVHEIYCVKFFQSYEGKFGQVFSGVNPCYYLHHKIYLVNNFNGKYLSLFYSYDLGVTNNRKSEWGLWFECVPYKTQMLKPNHQGDVIGSWSLWEVIGLRGFCLHELY